MTTRTCVYKDCENYSIAGVPCGNFTLFQFPKDPDRKKKWIELAKVQVPENLPPNELLICSQHFDKKYFSINQRRTILIGPAVPYPYEPVDDSNIASEEEQQEMPIQEEAPQTETSPPADSVASDGEQGYYKLDVHLQDSPASEDGYNCDILSDENGEDDDTIELNTAVSVTNNGTKKRKREPFLLAIADEKRWKSQVLPNNKEVRRLEIRETQYTCSPSNDNTRTVSKSSNKKSNSVQTQRETTNNYDHKAIDAKHVTTFIFKGEEYVQMPKEYYLQEKEALRRRIKVLETAVRGVKKCLDIIH